MPRISADSVSEHRDQVRRRIFDAFADLMGERSFDAITMAQIAERAGLGRTAIYHHFRDTEAVVVGFATAETAEYVEQLTAALEGTDRPVDQLRVYVRRNLEHGEQFHMGLGPSVFGLLSDASRQAIREHVIAVEDVLRGILTAGAASGELVVDDLRATVSLVHACLNPRHLPPDAIEAFVLRAVGATGAGPDQGQGSGVSG